jgi:hypothetical protein
MTVSQRLMKPGSFRVQLKPGVPFSISSRVDVLDHIVITPARLTPLGSFADADILNAAIYTGVVIDRPGRTAIDGCDPSWWLGTTTGRGVITSPTAVSSSSAITLSAWLALVLPFNGITVGTVTNTSTTSRAGRYQWMTHREALDGICQAAGAEWRIRPNFTVDAAVSSTLFATADPNVVVTRRRGGREGGRYGLEAELLSQGRNATNIATGATAVGSSGSSTATQAIGFVTPANGTPDLGMLVDARSEDTNLAATAAAVLASAGSLKTSLNVSAKSHNIPLRVKPGDGLYVFDPEAGIVDAANQIIYRGELITPMKLRVQALTWPIEAGMGVYLRKSGTTPTYVDLTDWVQWDTDDTYFEVGSADGWADEASPSIARLGANADVATINLAPVDYATSILVRQPGTITATVNEARFVRDGRQCEAWFDLTVTGAGTAPNVVTVSLPIASSGHTSAAIVGVGIVYDASAVVRYVCALELAGSDRVAFINDASGATAWGAAPNIALANGDILRGHVRFVVA